MNLRISDSKMIAGEIKELVSVIVDLRRKRVHGDIGYDLLTIIQSGDLKVEIGSDITSKPTEENWSFEVSIFSPFCDWCLFKCK